MVIVSLQSRPIVAAAESIVFQADHTMTPRASRFGVPSHLLNSEHGTESDGTHALLAVLACTPRSSEPLAPAREYLYLWTGSADSTQPDFLAVLDVTEGQLGPLRPSRYHPFPVPGLRNGPRHTEHEMPADRQLFTGLGSGESSSSI